MKITIESYEEKYSAETPNDDLNIYEVGNLIKGLLIASGFAQITINELF